jgi:hypothetical protein
VHRVVSEEIRQIVSGDEIVDRNNLHVTSLSNDAIDQTTNAAKSIDSNADGHVSSKISTGR